MKKKKGSRVVIRKFKRQFEVEEALLKIAKILLRGKS